MQVVHVSLFEWLKKLPAYRAGPAAAPRPFPHSGVAPCEDVIEGQQREIDQISRSSRGWKDASTGTRA